MKLKDIKKKVKDKDVEIEQMKRSRYLSREKLKSLEFFISIMRPSKKFLYKLYKIIQNKPVQTNTGLAVFQNIRFKRFINLVECQVQVISRFRSVNKVRLFNKYIFKIYKGIDNETELSSFINP